MKLVFYESLPESWLILVIGSFLSHSAYVIYKHRDRWAIYTILLFIRGLALTLILLYFYKPAIQYTEDSSYTPSIPIFIDNSFSLRNDLYFRKKKKWTPKYKYYKRLINKYFLNPKSKKKKGRFDLYTFQDQKMIQLDQLTSLKAPYGFFNVNRWLKTLKETSNMMPSPVILISDFNFRVNRKLLKKSGKRIYVVYRNERVYDTTIRSVDSDSGDNKGYQIYLEVIKRGKNTQNIVLTLYVKNKKLFQKSYSFTEKVNWVQVPVKFSFKKDTIIKAEIKNKRGEGNRLNNIYFFKVRGKSETKTVHLIFQKPSFDLSFLKKALKRLDKYKIKLYLPTPNRGPIKLKPISSRDKVVVGNSDQISPRNVKFLTRFVRKGGLLIFLKGNSHLYQLIKGNFSKLLPFFNRRNRGHVISKDSLTLSLTRLGKKQFFLNFREPQNAQKTWSDLPFFSSIQENIIPKKKSKVLAKLRDKPAILYQKHDRGIVMAVLADPLWKLDFSNLGFGAESNYYDQFWEELLQFNEIQGRGNIITLPKKIYQFGEKVNIFYPKSKFKQKDTVILRVKKENEFIEQPIELYKKNDRLISEFICRYLGENQIVLKRKGKPDKVLGYFYVNYPDWESIQFSNYRRKKIATLIAKRTNGKVLRIKDLKKITPAFFNNQEEWYKVIRESSLVHTISYLLLLVFLLALEWFIKRLALGK